jgi:hypothetical protein
MPIKMNVSLPADWPRCGEADGCASYCGHVGDGYGKRCWQHGGIHPPYRDWHIRYASNGIFLVHGDECQQISWRSAFGMIRNGRVKRGVFLQNKGKRLRERLAEFGVKSVVETPHPFVASYLFEVPCDNPCVYGVTVCPRYATCRPC